MEPVLTFGVDLDRPLVEGVLDLLVIVPPVGAVLVECDRVDVLVLPLLGELLVEQALGEELDVALGEEVKLDLSMN